jgi:hypothetical protein
MGSRLTQIIGDLQKEANEVGQGPPVLPSPPVAPAPVPMEEGKADPGRTAVERADQNPANEAMGDDPASMRVKIKQQVMAQAGQALSAATRGEGEEQVSMVLPPKSPEVMSPPAAPAGGGPGQLGEGPMGDIAESAAKMSSAIVLEAERLYDQHYKIAMEAQENGEPEKYAENAAIANGYAAIIRDNSVADGQAKQAAAAATLQGILERVRGGPNGAEKVADTPAETPAAPEGTQEKTAEEIETEEHIEKMASEYRSSGGIAGHGFIEAVDPVLTEKIAMLDERIEKLAELQAQFVEGLEAFAGLLGAQG